MVMLPISVIYLAMFPSAIADWSRVFAEIVSVLLGFLRTFYFNWRF